ncbi:MAG: hypothetical protein JSW61_12860 [Candidatus Thorarchaeota archaeon]|nr:MAG: hypothetical protein JSW61_12860 [Candidatus Thorarchaeota archaeon]
MGFRGKVAWRFMTPKVAKPLFQSMYRELLNLLISSSESVDAINEKLLDMGYKVGEHLLMDYAERIRAHAKAFHEFSSTLHLAYKVNSGQEFTNIWLSDDKRAVKFSDEECPLCEGVHITDMPGLQYCNLVSGVFQAVLDLRGFNGEAYQESCKAVGDGTCTWTIRLRD